MANWANCITPNSLADIFIKAVALFDPNAEYIPDIYETIGTLPTAIILANILPSKPCLRPNSFSNTAFSILFFSINLSILNLAGPLRSNILTLLPVVFVAWTTPFFALDVTISCCTNFLIIWLSASNLLFFIITFLYLVRNSGIL